MNTSSGLQNTKLKRYLVFRVILIRLQCENSKLYYAFQFFSEIPMFDIFDCVLRMPRKSKRISIFEIQNEDWCKKNARNHKFQKLLFIRSYSWKCYFTIKTIEWHFYFKSFRKHIICTRCVHYKFEATFSNWMKWNKLDYFVRIFQMNSKRLFKENCMRMKPPITRVCM